MTCINPTVIEVVLPNPAPAQTPADDLLPE
jgi:hypothetical protein